MDSSNSEDKMTPEVIKTITLLVKVTPKLGKFGRRLALPVEIKEDE